MNILRRIMARGLGVEEEAAISSEHALLLTLIAVGIMVALRAFSTSVSNSLYNASIALLPFGS